VLNLFLCLEWLIDENDVSSVRENCGQGWSVRHWVITSPRLRISQPVIKARQG